MYDLPAPDEAPSTAQYPSPPCICSPSRSLSPYQPPNPRCPVHGAEEYRSGRCAGCGRWFLPRVLVGEKCRSCTPGVKTATGFTVKDSGKRASYETGAQRDEQAGKGRFDLLDYYTLSRLARHMEKGAEKYDAHNWRKGIPLSRTLSSLLRHAHQLSAGHTDEDHAAAVLANAMFFVWTQREILQGRLPESLWDIPHKRENWLDLVA